ncbi:hypothetical protein ACLB2K_052179 [Fragaria x ananassa]
MASGGPNWEGLLLAHSDGTRPSRSLTEEDRKWFMEAMQEKTIDVVKRMKEISLVMQTPEHVLEDQGVTPADIEDMLDELQEHVESIDMDNDLHSIGGLVTLLDYLKNSNANIRAKAAEVVTTIVQNNPKSQKLVMEANGFTCLFSLLKSDPVVNVRTKALGAISSLIRHNKPGVIAFRIENMHMKPCEMLAFSTDVDVREGALQGLLVLARGKTEGVIEDEKLKQVLRKRIEDVGAGREERQLVDSLWNACYNEPSPLHENGLLVLPGEDAPPPDVASKHFEPALRALAPKP